MAADLFPAQRGTACTNAAITHLFPLSGHVCLYFLGGDTWLCNPLLRNSCPIGLTPSVSLEQEGVKEPLADKGLG